MRLRRMPAQEARRRRDRVCDLKSNVSLTHAAGSEQHRKPAHWQPWREQHPPRRELHSEVAESDGAKAWRRRRPEWAGYIGVGEGVEVDQLSHHAALRSRSRTKMRGPVLVMSRRSSAEWSTSSARSGPPSSRK